MHPSGNDIVMYINQIRDEDFDDNNGNNHH